MPEKDSVIILPLRRDLQKVMEQVVETLEKKVLGVDIRSKGMSMFRIFQEQ